MASSPVVFALVEADFSKEVSRASKVEGLRIVSFDICGQKAAKGCMGGSA